MGFKPLLSFRGTTIARAFLLNAILIGITTAFTIEVRRTINESQYTKDFPDIPHKVLATAFASTLIGLTAYILLRILFDVSTNQTLYIVLIISLFNLKYLYNEN